MKRREDFGIVFMGTPQFAVPTLGLLADSGYQIKAVVTSPDKPRGRGLKVSPLPVRQFALDRGFKTLQPVSLRDESFLASLDSLKADLFVVVAFRMLPKQVWQMPGYGTINLHASLLPWYRGAAPINHALIGGEKITGITTFFIDQQMDAGNIIGQRSLAIGDDETAGELHDRLMTEGAALVLDTVDAIRLGTARATPQPEQSEANIEWKAAPKITRELCRIDWTQPSQEIHNLVRGLSPQPGAFTLLQPPEGDMLEAKIIRTSLTAQCGCPKEANWCTDGDRNRLFIATGDGYIEITELQMPGKSRLSAEVFLRGSRLNNLWKFV